MKFSFIIWLILFSCSFFEADATHIVGGEFTYQYLGDTLGFLSKYRINVSIYEDCQNGSITAIAADNPAYIVVFENNKTINRDSILADNVLGFDSIFYSFSEMVPVNFSNSCVSNIPKTCLLKKTFTRIYYLPHNTSGYIITYQRCCRNAEIDNILDPGNTGSTFYGTIPPYPLVNNSAVFKNYPPQIICLNNPLYYDNSATDADGDSLSYQFCTSLNCCGGIMATSKPIPLSPDEFPPLYYDSINYMSGFSSLHPMTGFPPISIDPVTGLITGTPNLVGRFLVTVCCNEWRNGVLINTIKREFQFVVTPCSKKVLADIPQYSTDPNTYIVDCNDYIVNFVNTSSGGFSWHWDFGLPHTSYDTSSAFEPTFTYPDTGTFSVVLTVNPGSTCPDSISRFVKVYPRFRANFSDSGQLCPGDTVSFKDLSSASIKPIVYWKWEFGDGDSSLIQNPAHSYSVGGTYNVVLISQSIKYCTDTVLKQVLVETFRPFAGNDTIIVKGEHILFNATGGIKYAWSPGTNLDSLNIYNPIGNYPVTGQYSYVVSVESAFGCSGYDTINVSVVDQAEFFVPGAFSPNGDGLNDIFRPIAVGYKNLNYFAVFNRWGQRVYLGFSLEDGWDGTFGGVKAELGVYFWEISFTDRFGKTGAVRGDVTLVR